MEPAHTMPPAAQDAPAILSALAQHELGRPVSPGSWQLVAQGASGRQVLRTEGLIGICWTAARPDNLSFLPAAHGLGQAGLHVPEVLAETELDAGGGACLVTDLGTCDLLSLRDQPWSLRRDAYLKAMEALAPLYRLKPDWTLQPPFDAALYRWEQEYFAEHFLGRHLGMPAREFLGNKALLELADWLSSLPRCPIHRDCQSQNIILHQGDAYLIDFQGMRMGRAEYDLASLAYDPYMALTQEERSELLRLWEQCIGKRTDPAILSACTLQRLMQALGAFANIGYNQNRSWYLELIPTGIAALRDAALSTPASSPATPAAQWLLAHLPA